MIRQTERIASLLALLAATGGCATARVRLDVAAAELPARPAVVEVDSDPEDAQVVLFAGPGEPVAECAQTPCRIQAPPGRYRLQLQKGSVHWMAEYRYDLELELAPCTAEHVTVQLASNRLARAEGYGGSALLAGLGVPALLVGGAWTGVGAAMIGLSGLLFWRTHDLASHRGEVTSRARYPLGAEPGGPAAPAACAAPPGGAAEAPPAAAAE